MLYAILSGVTSDRLSVPNSGEVKNTPLEGEEKELHSELAEAKVD